MEEVRIIGIDPSLRSTGLAVFSGESVRWEHLRYPKDTTRAEILTSTMRFFKEAPEPGKWIAGIEGYSYSNNMSSGFTPTVEVGGVIRAAVGGWASWIEIPPVTWRWAILGKRCKEIKKGTIEKNRHYIEVVCECLDMDAVFKSTDEADAYCIGEYVRRLIDGSIKLSKTAPRISGQFKLAMEG